MIEKVRLKSRGGWKIAGALHLPPGKGPFPGVVICHGFTSSKDSPTNKGMAEALSKDGFATLSIDLYGSGESDGKLQDTTVSKQVEDLLGALDFMEKHPKIDAKKLGVFGSSLGGMVAALGSSKDRRIKSAVLKAPVCDMKEIVNNIFSEVSKSGLDLTGFMENHRDGKTVKMRYEFYTNAVEQSLYSVAKKIRCPVLIVHGTSDAIVPIEQSEKLISMLGRPSMIKRVQGADHDFNNKNHALLRSEAVGWFRKYMEAGK